MYIMLLWDEIICKYKLNPTGPAHSLSSPLPFFFFFWPGRSNQWLQWSVKIFYCEILCFAVNLSSKSTKIFLICLVLLCQLHICLQGLYSLFGLIHLILHSDLLCVCNEFFLKSFLSDISNVTWAFIFHSIFMGYLFTFLHFMSVCIFVLR